MTRLARRVRMTRLRARGWWIRRQLAFLRWQMLVLGGEP